MRKYWTKGRPKPSWANSKLCTSCMMSKLFSDLQLLSALLIATHSFLLGCFYFLLPAFLAGYPTTLSSLASWGLHSNPGFTFIASHNGTSRPPRRDTQDTLLASSTSLSQGGRFHNSFLVSLTLNPELCGQHCQVLLLAGAKTWPPCSNTFSPGFWV